MLSPQQKIKYLQVVLNYKLKQIADESGVSYNALRKFACGNRPNLNEENTSKLNKYLAQFTYEKF